MCVAGSHDERGGILSRSAFVAIAAAAALPLTAASAAPAEAADLGRSELPAPLAPLSRGNAQAAAYARESSFAHTTYAHVEARARSIADATLRESVQSLLRSPRPEYARAHPRMEDREAVRDALADAHFVAVDAPISGIFPAGTEPDATLGIQPFWSAPGSGEGSHHAYPGGLATHEYFNATIAQGFAQTYDRVYFNGRSTVDRDTVIGAALYHDIMKTVVFQWNDDGTLFEELTIAGTGAHHILSGAEAIARGRSPRFVTVLLSAHAAPSLGDEVKVAAWCKASAIVAGVDPHVYGLLHADGTLAADPAPLECFVNYLSDHDYVLSVHAMHVIGARLRSRYASLEATLVSAPPLTFAWYRSAVLTKTTAIALYDTLARAGESAFSRELRRIEATIVLR